ADAASTIKKGDVVTCTVSAVQDGGVEVAVADGMTGFIRKGELSRDRSEQRPDRFAVGEKVDAKVMSIDTKARRVTLSIKAREMEEEKQAMADYGSSDSVASLGEILGAAISKAQRDRTAKAEAAGEGDAKSKGRSKPGKGKDQEGDVESEAQEGGSDA